METDNHIQMEPEDLLQELLSIKLDAALRESLEFMDREQARFLIDNYYNLQRWRIRYCNQTRKLEERSVEHGVIKWQGDCALRLEKQSAVAICFYASGQPMGRWGMANLVIWPILAAG